MCCIFALIGLIVPRVFMVFIALLTNWFGMAFDSVLWPVLGWIFLPYTTLAYMAAMINNNHHLDGWWVVLLVFAVLADVGILGGSGRRH